MIIKKIPAVLIILFVITGLIRPQNLTMKSATVAGFINKGKSNQDNINKIMTKSLATFLSKISKNITPYKDVEEIAGGTNFWSLKALDDGKAINIAQHFSTEQVITGDYIINEKSDKIIINVFVYNVIDGQVLFNRSYKGDAGPGIFDTIDKMILDVSGLLVGKTISLGYFKLDIKPKNVNYRLFINGSFVKPVDSRDGYFDKFISGQSIDISLKPGNSEEEALRKIIQIESGKTNELAYNPSGVLMIEAMEGGIDVYLNGEKIGKTDNSGEVIITDVDAGKGNKIELKKGDALLSVTNIALSEGQTKAVVFKNSASPAVENKTNEEIEIPAKSDWSGIKYIAKDPGTYKFEIIRGYYKTRLGHKTKIVAYKNRNIIFNNEGWAILFDYQMGSGQEESSARIAEIKGKGQSITVKLQKDDFVNFIQSDGTYEYGSREGNIFLSVNRLSTN